MSTETESGSESRYSPDSLIGIMHIEATSKRRARHEKLASYFLVAFVVLETVNLATGSSFTRWLVVVCLCMYTAMWLGRARIYRARLMELTERHREVLNE